MSIRRFLEARSLRFQFATDAHHQARYIWVTTIGLVLLLNLIMLFVYQHRLGADFPVADEWGELNRLARLPDLGFFHYLFDRYQAYYMPMFLFIWYLFYALFHLDLMAMRYTGAVVSALVALMFCMLLRRESSRLNVTTIGAILCAPFVVCSYNHGAAYSQAIESLTEPLLFGLVLATSWAAEFTLQRERRVQGIVLCVTGSLVASGIYAPGLALLPAIVAAYCVLQRRIDWVAATLGFAAAGLLFIYLKIGANGDLGSTFSAVGVDDLPRSLVIFLGLTGNAVLSPGGASLENLTLVIGAGILLVQFLAVIHVLIIPFEQRRRFMLPLVLTLYNGLVFAQILLARIDFPRVEFTPRYSTHMLGGVASILFWAVTLADARPRVTWLVNMVLALVACGVVVGEVQGESRIKPVHTAMQKERRALLSLSADPGVAEQQAAFVNPPMRPLVYPGKLFLETHSLALYQDGPVKAPSAMAVPLVIDDFGPKAVAAISDQTAASRPGVVGLWIRVNRDIVADGVIVVDGTELPTAVDGDVLTAALPAAILERAGAYPVYVRESDGIHSLQSDKVEITVR